MGMTVTAEQIRVYEPWVARRQFQYVCEALAKNELTFRGGFVPRFEAALARALGVKHVVTTCNGSVSLFALYRLLFGGSGKKLVVVPTMTYAATVSQLILAGFSPVYIDCDDNFRADLSQLRLVLKQLKDELAGVVIPCLYADAPDMAEVQEMCASHWVPLVADAAEAFRCKQLGSDVGAFAQAASYSFFANKVITSGEGGCVTTNCDYVAERVRSFCNQNALTNYTHSGPGTNFRMTNLQAAVGLAQLEDVETIIDRKLDIAETYRDMLNYEAVVPGCEASSEWMPVFRLPGVEYDRFAAHCRTNGVETRPTFPPVHKMAGFAGLVPFGAETSEWQVGRHFILPCYPAMTYEQINRVVEVANSYDGS
jgi:perosamine synthetase